MLSPERAFRFIIVRVLVVFEAVAVWYCEFAIVASESVLGNCWKALLPLACYC